MTFELIIGLLALIISGGALYYAKNSYFIQKYPDGGLEGFCKYLKDINGWKKINTSTDENTIWRYINNVDYELVIQFDSKWETKETWIPNFPDSSSAKYNIFLRIRGKDILEYPIIFISMDGGRWFLPIPEIGPNGEYFWKNNDVRILVDKIIGCYYGGVFPKNLQEFADRYNVSFI